MHSWRQRKLSSGLNGVNLYYVPPIMHYFKDLMQLTLRIEPNKENFARWSFQVSQFCRIFPFSCYFSSCFVNQTLVHLFGVTERKPCKNSPKACYFHALESIGSCSKPPSNGLLCPAGQPRIGLGSKPGFPCLEFNIFFLLTKEIDLYCRNLASDFH